MTAKRSWIKLPIEIDHKVVRARILQGCPSESHELLEPLVDAIVMELELLVTEIGLHLMSVREHQGMLAKRVCDLEDEVPK